MNLYGVIIMGEILNVTYLEYRLKSRSYGIIDKRH